MNNKCYRILLSGRAPEISINRNVVHRNLRRKTFLITLLFNRERKLCVALPSLPICYFSKPMRAHETTTQ